MTEYHPRILKLTKVDSCKPKPGKMKGILLSIPILLLGIAIAKAQTILILSANQPSKLEAYAGSDTVTFLNNPVTLGGEPAATGGTAPYSFLWSDGSVDVSTESNPVVNPSEYTTYILTVIDGNSCIATDDISVSIDFTGIDDRFGESLRIYPNPSSNMFTVELNGGTCNISLIDNKGRLLWTRQLTGKSSFAAPHNPGVYFLRINDEEKEAVRTIVITK